LTRLKVGVIGCGYWGPNLVRTFVEIPQVTVKAVADLDQRRLEHIGSRYPQIKHLSRDYRQLFHMGLDAVIISTPPETHFPVAKACLEEGLDVLVEKPLSTSTADASHLVELARERDCILMVGHIGAYHSSIRALREMIDDGELGEIRYIDAVRAGLGLFHPTLNVIWDLAPHDISILVHILGASPVSVSTRGIACVEASIEDVAYMTLMFPNGVLAHSRMSWLDPCKTRRITVVGTKKMVVFDDVESHEKLRIYDKSVNAIRPTDTFGEFHFAYNYGSVISPYIEFEEPLRMECLHFLECVSEHKEPLTDGQDGLRVVEVIEAAQRSLRGGGIEVFSGRTTQRVDGVGDVVPMNGRMGRHGGDFSIKSTTKANPYGQRGIDRDLDSVISADKVRGPAESKPGSRDIPLLGNLTDGSINE
jgi:predicted dehydrogenase